MSGLHPQYMLSKRFPVHAAIELQDLQSFASLLCNQREADYHFDRKLTNSEASVQNRHSCRTLRAWVLFLMIYSLQVSVLHQACCARALARPHWVDMVRVCLHLGASHVNDVDCIGQTPLFYAVSHVQAAEIVPLILRAGRYQQVHNQMDLQY